MSSARSAEVQRELRARAYRRREELRAALTWFVAEGLALRLARHVTIRDQLLLSGDLMLHACLGGEAPFEWQIELLAVGPVTPAELARRLREVCDVPVDDGLDLELPAGGLSEPTSISGGRYAVVTLVGHLGAMKLPLQVAVRLDESLREKPCDFLFVSSLGNSLSARVLACPPTALAALRLRDAFDIGAAPGGVKVLWDLFRLIESGKVDPNLAPDAVAAAFRCHSRSTPVSLPLLLNDAFAADACRQQVWAAFVQRARLTAPDFSEVVTRIQREILPWLVQEPQGRGGRSAVVSDDPFGWLAL